MQYFKTKFKNGFTLVELVIVIAVIGIMAAGIISIVDPLAQFQKAWDAKRKSDLSQIQKALEVFYQDNGKYPDAVDNKIKRADGSVADWGEQWTPYVEKLPADPVAKKNYVYVNSNEQTYYLYASLDRAENDPQVCHPDGTKCDNAPVLGCGTEAVCNYGISTQNVSP